jgi:hypothetical protein
MSTPWKAASRYHIASNTFAEVLPGCYYQSYTLGGRDQFKGSFPGCAGVFFHFEMPETLAYSYSGVGLHVWSCGHGFLVESEGDGVLFPSIVHSSFSDEGNDVVGIPFKQYLE